MLEKKAVKVLIVDDSALFRQMLTKVLTGNGIEIVGTAGDAYEARDKILKLHPDVVTLDIEMPKMNGIQFLEKLIPQYPIPVVVVTSSAINAFEAIDSGAVDYVKKPVVKSPDDMDSFGQEIRSKVVIAAVAKVRTPHIRRVSAQDKPEIFRPIVSTAASGNKIIAIGASTGGTEAIQTVMEKLPADCPPIVIVQHMPAGFTKMYAKRIDKICQMEVREAADGMRLQKGLAVIAAGEFHMRLHKDLRGYYISSKQGERVSGHCPSVDVLFSSVAETAKENAVGVILTGMGGDGAKGLLEMKKAGAFTIGQDKESCTVYGMPMVAFNIGAVCVQAPLDKIPEMIYDNLSGK